MILSVQQEMVPVTSCYTIHSVRKKPVQGHVVHFFPKNLKDPTNTTIFRQAPSTLTANTVNNNCDMAPDEV
ncbi:hypothetical protein E2C01_043984 [Portunus trituberculatus]|uniref:Uncharacterized protein n=1 Tax=Portunus trituberculatus TaxID=210409 RepID=A0A5B7FRX2_PORTR|nr:hypothetical protein [Portunus trituberculatus]